jgi:hypothetical protein
VSVTDDLCALLVTAGVGVLGADVFAGGIGLPELPDGDPATGLVQLGEPYGGDASIRTMGTAPTPPALEAPRVQALIRAATYETARTKAAAVIAALDWAGDVDVNGRRYALITALQRPAFLLEWDVNGRYVFATNFSVLRAGV